MAPIISFFGPPACGKSTQGQLLAQARGWHHLSTGAALRALNDPWLNDHLAKGNFAPEYLVTEILKEAIGALRTGRYKGLVLDGVPRHFAQVLGLKYLVHTYGGGHVQLLGVVHLTCSKEVAQQRTQARTGRAEDKAFVTRWRLYHGEVHDMQKACGFLGIPFRKVNAERSPESVADKIQRVLALIL